jgi:peptidyl-prolyl cis-trans isomerase D
MLQSFREQIKGWVATVVIGLLIIPFALWGVNSYFDYGDSSWVAQIDDDQISQAEFRNEFQQQLNRFQQMLGEQYRPELFDTPQTRARVLDQMVERALVERRARAAGYRVGDAELAEEIRGIDAFHVDGKFDRKVMRDRLASIGLTEAAFDARLRRDMTLAQLPEAIRASEFALPGEVERATALLQEQRNATWIAVPAIKFLPEVRIADADVEQYYQANQAQFMTEESVTLEYLELSPETLPPDATVPSDAELSDIYQQEKARFSEPEQRRAVHILVLVEPGEDAKAEAEAKALLARVQKGEDFATLAQQESDDPGTASSGGDLGLIKRGDTVGAFEDAVFSMQVGEVRGPVKSEFGYHVIRLEEVRPGAEQPFAQVKAQLAAEWQQRQAAERYGKAAEQLADLAYSNPDSLAAAADALGLIIGRVAGVTRSGGADIATEQRVRDAAFAPEVLVEKRNSGMIELGEAQVVVVRVAEHTPAALRPLAEVRDEVVGRLRDARATEMAQAKADAVAAELRRGARPDEVAKREKLPSPMVRSLTRNAQDAPPEVAEALFAAGKPAGAPIVGVTKLGNGDRMVFRLESVVPGDAAGMSQAQRDARRDQLAQRSAGMTEAAYVEALKRDAEVKLQPENTR